MRVQKTRHNEIISVLGERDSASVSELSKLLGVSEVTVRSDLNSLAQTGLVRRTRGGVTRPLGISERPLEESSKQQASVKRRIGEAAAGMV